MKILLFETDETIRNLYREILEGFGWRVVLATSINELKIVVGRENGGFDSVILDLPYDEAQMTFRLLKFFGSETQITLISSGLRPETWKAVKEVKENVRLVVPKPYTPEEVLRLGDSKRSPK